MPPLGPVVVSDVGLLEKLLLFNREKTPARNVHALGTGVYGKFTVTNDISQYTKAKLFSSVGKETKVFARFSGIFTEQGESGILEDLLSNSTPRKEIGTFLALIPQSLM